MFKLMNKKIITILHTLDLCSMSLVVKKPGQGVIKLEFILKLKIKCNDWLLRYKP